MTTHYQFPTEPDPMLNTRLAKAFADARIPTAVLDEFFTGHPNKVSEHCANLDDQSLADEIKRYIDIFVAAELVEDESRHLATYILDAMCSEFTRRVWKRGCKTWALPGAG